MIIKNNSYHNNILELILTLLRLTNKVEKVGKLLDPGVQLTFVFSFYNLVVGCKKFEPLVFFLKEINQCQLNYKTLNNFNIKISYNINLNIHVFIGIESHLFFLMKQQNFNESKRNKPKYKETEKTNITKNT